MIMKNEAKVLRRCLDSVRGLVKEIIICDTGSTDDSIKIAEAYAAKIVKRPWDDDFAAPRNLAMSYASGDWILILDPDEVLKTSDHAAVRSLTRRTDAVAFQMTTRNYTHAKNEPTYRSLGKGTDPTGKYTGYVPSTKTRFVKNGLNIVFEGCYHELLDWNILRRKMSSKITDIPIHHWNHEFSQASVKAKGDMYLRLAYKKVKQMPNFGQAWWELAVAQAIQGIRAGAASSLAKAFTLGFGGANEYFTMSRILRMIGKKSKGSYAFEKGVCKLFPALTHIDMKQKQLSTLVEGLL